MHTPLWGDLTAEKLYVRSILHSSDEMSWVQGVEEAEANYYGLNISKELFSSDLGIVEDRMDGGFATLKEKIVQMDEKMTRLERQN